MDGCDGNDSYYVTQGDVLLDSPGIDTAYAELSFAIPWGTENITYIGTNRTESVGNGQNNVMTGNVAANYLEGRDGNDTLIGAAGNDTLVGGTGADSFVFREWGAANADQVTDFVSGTDKIGLDHTAFGLSGNFVAGDARFYAGAAAHDADDRVIYDTSTGQLYYDADGNGAGAAQLIATLTTHPAVAATDITVL
jgi:serralysin